MASSQGYLGASNAPPNILVDRVLTGTVFNMMIHSAVFYGLRILIDLYHIVFLFDLPELGFLKLVKHPFQFFFTTVFSFGWFMLCGVVGMLTWMNYRRLEWVSPQKTSRLAVRFNNGVYLVGHFLLGVFLGSVVLRLIDRKGYVGSIETADKIVGLDERYTFVLLSCGVIGAYYQLNFISSCGYTINFPKHETASLIRLRGIVIPTLKESSHFTIHAIILSYLVHSIVGPILHQFVSVITLAGISDKPKELVSFGSYFDVELLILTVLSQALVVFTLKSVWLAMEVLITTRVKFRVEDDMPGVKSLLLRDMLTSDNLYVKKLAYYDLRLLAEFDEIRMKSLFVLSHPGGFPKIWNSVSRACLDQIRKMTNDLKAHVDKIMCDKKKAETRAIDEATERLTGPRVYFMSSPSDAVTDSMARNRFPQNAMRNLNTPYEGDGKPTGMEANGDLYSEFWDNPFAPVGKLTAAFFDVATKYLLKLLSVLNLLKFFKDRTDMDVASIFKDQETVMWSVLSLTDIVVASKRIDSKGVVQSDISVILTSLTDLCAALDDFKSLQDGRSGTLIPNVGIKTAGGGNSAVKALVQGVRRPLKNEIMRIHANFRPYYDIICIPSRCEQMLKKIAYYD